MQIAFTSTWRSLCASFKVNEPLWGIQGPDVEGFVEVDDAVDVDRKLLKLWSDFS